MKIPAEIRFGIYFGISMCLYTILMWLTKLDTTYLEKGEFLEKAVLILPLTFTFLAIWAKSKEIYLTNDKRVLCGLIVNFVSFLIYFPFLAIYHHFINPDWLKYVLDLKEKQLLAQNVAPDKINKTLSSIAATSNDFNFAVNGLIGVLIFGFIISLLTILFIRSKPKLT